MNEVDKKDVLYLGLLLLFLCIIIVGPFLFFAYFGNRANRKHLLEREYLEQNLAFGKKNCNEFAGIGDFNEVELIDLCYYLAAYKEAVNSDDIPTVEEVKQYLSDKYDKHLKLAVLNKPYDLDQYIKWFCSCDGIIYRDYYNQWVRAYRFDHLDRYGDMGKYEMTEEQAMSLLEDFRNCSDKQKYKEQTRFDYETIERESRIDFDKSG